MRFRTLCVALLLASLLPAWAASAVAQSPPDQGSELPDGDAKTIVASACMQCHTAERITSAARSLENWKNIVSDMISNGAEVKPEEADKVVQYLAKNFGPANAQARLQAASEKAAAEPFLFIPVANVYQLMKAIIIPASDAVWNVAAEEPKDDQEWAAVQHSALTLAEAGNLLMIGSRAKDQGNWIKAAQAMINDATVIFRAAEARNVAALNEAGDKLVGTCANCHRQYKQSPQ